MMKKQIGFHVILAAAVCMTWGLASGQPHTYVPQGAQKHIYKTAGDEDLHVWEFRPDTPLDKGNNPAIVFYFGGGWNSGSVKQFEPQANYLAGRGMTALLVEYRTRKSSGTTPLESVADAKSAMRFVRANASALGIDPGRIVASGGSAGGHLAAATAYVTAFDDPADNPRVSAVPDALVLFNPVVDNSAEGYGAERLGEKWRDFSPMHNITPENVRPALFLVGSADHLIPVSTGEAYAAATRNAGGRCDLEVYDSAGHGFFNYGRKPKTNEPDYYNLTLKRVDEFLVSLGYLPAPESTR